MNTAEMQYSSLIAFLSGRLAPATLAEEISGEVAAFYAELRDAKVGFIRVSSGPTFIMDKTAARRLLEAIADRQLPAEAAVYVADCIVASEYIEFADDETREAVAFVEDDSSQFIAERSEMWTNEEISRALRMLD